MVSVGGITSRTTGDYIYYIYYYNFLYCSSVSGRRTVLHRLNEFDSADTAFIKVVSFGYVEDTKSSIAMAEINRERVGIFSWCAICLKQKQYIQNADKTPSLYYRNIP